MKAPLRTAIGWLWIGIFGGLLWAHPGIDEQLRELSGRIERDPTDAALYLERGEVHRLHRDWDSARADYDRVARMAPEIAVVDLCRARLELEAGRVGKAAKALRRYLKVRPGDSEGLLVQARIAVKRGDPLEGARLFTAAMDASAERPTPDFYFERAQAFRAAGPDHLDEAIRGLDEGVERLGEPVTLQLYAMELEIELGRYDAALVRLDRLEAQSRRKERWLLERGRLLERAGRLEEAKAAFRRSLSSVEELPPSRRMTAAVAQIEAAARAALERLDVSR